MKRKKAKLKVWDNWWTFSLIPIWVYDIVSADLFPIKFEYRARGYKGLRFIERSSNIIFE